MVNTSNRIKTAALQLFLENGYARTSIGAIEKAAGLAPRAGAFYRHFASKQALLEELAETQISETPDEFNFDDLKAFGNTKAELVAIAITYEKASARQAPYLRLIEELRRTPEGSELENKVNQDLVKALMDWVSTKPAGTELDDGALAGLTMAIFGGWLFYLTKVQSGVEVDFVNRDDVLEQWASTWARVLDSDSD
jgi:AcrR family transcriptional regulator